MALHTTPDGRAQKSSYKSMICSSCGTMMKKTDMDLIEMFKAKDGGCALSFG
jgi:hypothetical protein